MSTDIVILIEDAEDCEKVHHSGRSYGKDECGFRPSKDRQGYLRLYYKMKCLSQRKNGTSFKFL